MQGGPHNNVIAAQAVAFAEALTPAFKEYQRDVVSNAKTLAEALMKKEFNLITGGTDTHLILIDMRSKGLTGSEAETMLEKAGIIANRNTIPGDKSPFRPSGIRMGTPAVTTRGLKEKEMEIISGWINELISEKESPEKIRKEVLRLTKRFPFSY